MAVFLKVYLGVLVLNAVLSKHRRHFGRAAVAARNWLAFLLGRCDRVVATEALQAARGAQTEHLAYRGHSEEFLSVDCASKFLQFLQGGLQVAISHLSVGLLLLICVLA